MQHLRLFNYSSNPFVSFNLGPVREEVRSIERFHRRHGGHIGAPKQLLHNNLFAC